MESSWFVGLKNPMSSATNVSNSRSLHPAAGSRGCSSRVNAGAKIMEEAVFTNVSRNPREAKF